VKDFCPEGVSGFSEFNRKVGSLLAACGFRGKLEDAVGEMEKATDGLEGVLVFEKDPDQVYDRKAKTPDPVLNYLFEPEGSYWDVSKGAALLETEHPGIVPWIFSVLESCPIFIGTPKGLAWMFGNQWGAGLADSDGETGDGDGEEEEEDHVAGARNLWRETVPEWALADAPCDFAPDGAPENIVGLVREIARISEELDILLEKGCWRCKRGDCVPFPVATFAFDEEGICYSIVNDAWTNLQECGENPGFEIAPGPDAVRVIRAIADLIEKTKELCHKMERHRES
jgi:hypothetical protein